MTESQPFDVVDEEDENRFVLTADGSEAELVYRSEPSRLVLEHTEVPESLGGRGFGGALVRAAVSRARTRGEIVAPVCSYARHWLEKHPDETASIAIDWSEQR